MSVAVHTFERHPWAVTVRTACETRSLVINRISLVFEYAGRVDLLPEGNESLPSPNRSEAKQQSNHVAREEARSTPRTSTSAYISGKMHCCIYKGGCAQRDCD